MALSLPWLVGEALILPILGVSAVSDPSALPRSARSPASRRVEGKAAGTQSEKHSMEEGAMGWKSHSGLSVIFRLFLCLDEE